jgi:division protein CdvB (Snf7/Vps24/ESCRT-III family)
VGAFSIFRKVEDKFHPVPLRERLEHASFRLQAQFEKLEHMYTRLQQRDKELFQRCVGAQLSNDPGHAKIFANECAEIRKIAKVVLGSQLALEKVILRLQTVEEFGTIMSQIAPVIGIVKETKSKIAGIVPQVASELEEVNVMLGDLTDETGEVTSNSVQVEPTDEDARKVLEETGLIAEQKLRDHFPELPVIEPQTAHIVPTIPEPASDIPDMEGFEDSVYEYARKHDRELSVQSCAQELGASPIEVKTALQRLRETGKVVIE